MDTVGRKEIFQLLWALVVKAVEPRLEATARQDAVDVCDRVGEVLCLARLDGSHEYIVAVVVIGYQQVVVACA